MDVTPGTTVPLDATATIAPHVAPTPTSTTAIITPHIPLRCYWNLRMNDPLGNRMSLYFHVGGLVILSFLFLTACIPPIAEMVNPADAQKMVFQAATKDQSPHTVASYTVLGSRAGIQGHVIAYWMCKTAAPDQPAVALSGFGVVRRFWGETQIYMLGNSEARLPKADSLIELTANVLEPSDGKMYLAYGRILSPLVKSVEVEYTDQQRLRWPAGSGGFLLFRNEPVDWVRLNVLGQNDQVLKTYELSKDISTLSERAEGESQKCSQTK